MMAITTGVPDSICMAISTGVHSTYKCSALYKQRKAVTQATILSSEGSAKQMGLACFTCFHNMTKTYINNLLQFYNGQPFLTTQLGWMKIYCESLLKMELYLDYSTGSNQNVQLGFISRRSNMSLSCQLQTCDQIEFSLLPLSTLYCFNAELSLFYSSYRFMFFNRYAFSNIQLDFLSLLCVCSFYDVLSRKISGVLV